MGLLSSRVRRLLAVLFGFSLTLMMTDVSAEEKAAEAVAEGAKEPVDEICHDMAWELKGASTEHRSGNVSYRAQWTPVLEEVVACAEALGKSDTCIKVQGQYDNLPFPPRVVATFGSQEAAQKARANARAAMVATKLQTLGIETELMQIVAPPEEPTFRGASVTVVPECTPDGQTQTIILNTPAPPPAEVDADALAEAVAAKLAARERKEEEKPPEPSVHRVWFDLGLHATVLVHDPGGDDLATFAYLFDAGFGWHSDILYARIYGGFGIGHPEEHRYAADFGLGFGYYREPLVQVGLVGGMRHTWAEMSAWLERSWHLGFEATQCVLSFKGGDLCVREMFSPLGGSETRLELDDGELVRLDPYADYVLRFGLGLLVRFNVL